MWEEAGVGYEEVELCWRVQTLPKSIKKKKKKKKAPVLAKQNAYVRQIWFKACQFVIGVNVAGGWGGGGVGGGGKLVLSKLCIGHSFDCPGKEFGTQL